MISDCIDHNVFKKVAVINDLTGFGRCALSVEMPIISHMGIQCCPVPTSIFSNHSAFSSFFSTDYTPNMRAYIEEWKKLKLDFDGILTGFYSSKEQIDIAIEFIQHFAKKDGIVVVDPIMGDNGHAYSTYNDTMCNKMSEMVRYADVLTPNLTELCILAGQKFDENLNNNEIARLCEKVKFNLINKNAVIIVTGIKRGNYITNLIYSAGKVDYVRKRKVGDTRCGTGDVFASIIVAGLVKGYDVKKSVKMAADFVSDCIIESDRINMPKTDGVCFEKILRKLG